MALVPDDELHRYNEYWKAQFESFPQLIYEALDPRTPSLIDGMTNADVLTALESFGTILAIEANEGIAIIRKLFEKTINTRKAVADYLAKLKTDEEEAEKFLVDAAAAPDRQSQRVLRPLLACLATKSAAEAGTPPNLYGGQLSFKRIGPDGPVWILAEFENKPGSVRVEFHRTSSPPQSHGGPDQGTRVVVVSREGLPSP